MGFVIVIIVVMWNIIGRAAFNAPYAKSYEVVQYGVMACVLLGLTRTTSTDGHISVTLLTEKLPWRIKNFILGFGRLVSVAIYGCVAWLYITAIPEDIARNRMTGLFKIPFQYIDWMFVIFLAICALIFLYQAVVYFAKMCAKTDPDAVSLSDAADAADSVPQE